MLEHAATQEITSVSSDLEQSFLADFSLDRELPSEIGFLNTLSKNFRWSWDDESVSIFRDLDPVLWDKSEQSPRVLLKEVSSLRLWQCASDASYVSRLNGIEKSFHEYIGRVTNSYDGISENNPIAYFCAEYGIHNSLPIYSGGLGILSGDHLKSASDLALPLVAVGLMYRYGYFRQKVAHDGWQEERYVDSFKTERALETVRDSNGVEVRVSVRMRGREVFAKAWKARVGKVDLYLLDTNVEENDPVDRYVTGHLYGGDSETRIVQEMILGIGGVRLLRELGIEPSVFHLNEGHSAFLSLELAREKIVQTPSLSFVDVLPSVSKRCVFTTHTPVEAGNDSFEPKLLASCFDDSFVGALGISYEDLMELGRTDPEDREEWFGMTPLALRMCRSSNGVSKKHGEVSRGLWKKMYPQEIAVEEVPITSITNGVHPPTWIDPLLKSLFTDEIGKDWSGLVTDEAKWSEAIEAIPSEKLWRAHQSAKNLLVAFVRERTKRKSTGKEHTIHEHRDTANLLDPNALTIGFARRIAAYKRWNLIMSDLDRLLKMVDHEERPIQFVFAGKAHPQDRKAKGILRELMTINSDSKWQDRAVFIDDYDQEIARYLVHGVDVWMNVPRRPLEASGTSGQKAAMNGILNFSVLDGWWLEGYNGKNGFAIGPPEDPAGLSEDELDAADAESLYKMLEETIIPTFYDKNENGVPEKWVAQMKNSIASLTNAFSSDRMVQDYLNEIYRK